MLTLMARRITVALLVITVTGAPVLAGAPTCCHRAMSATASDTGETQSCCCAARATTHVTKDAPRKNCCAPQSQACCCSPQPPAGESIAVSSSIPCSCKLRELVPAVAEQRERIERRWTQVTPGCLAPGPGATAAAGVPARQVLDRAAIPRAAPLCKLFCRWTI
jgi:hypothetical protein